MLLEARLGHLDVSQQKASSPNRTTTRCATAHSASHWSAMAGGEQMATVVPPFALVDSVCGRPLTSNLLPAERCTSPSAQFLFPSS
jgi:hypothetical protein